MEQESTEAMEKCIEHQISGAKSESEESTNAENVKTVWLDTKNQYIYDFVPPVKTAIKCDVVQSTHRYIDPSSLPNGNFIYKSSILSAAVDEKDYYGHELEIHKFYFPSELMNSPETSSSVMETIQVKSSDGFDSVVDANRELMNMESENNALLSSLSTTEANKKDESKGMSNEADCMFCSLKHVSTAYALWNEFQTNPAYQLEFVMALGELRAAELHLVSKHPDECYLVRELRLAIEQGAHAFDAFRKVLMVIADKAEIFA